MNDPVTQNEKRHAILKRLAGSVPVPKIESARTDERFDAWVAANASYKRADIM